MDFITNIPVFSQLQNFWKFHFFFLICKLFFFQKNSRPETTARRAYQFYDIPCNEFGLTLTTVSKRAILVDPCFASYRPNMTSLWRHFGLWKLRNFNFQIGCQVDVPKCTTSFVSIVPLVWQLLRKTGGALDSLSMGRGLNARKATARYIYHS